MVKIAIHSISINYDTKEITVLLDGRVTCIRKKRSWYAWFHGHEIEKLSRDDPMFQRLETIYHALQPYQGGVFV